MADYQRATHMCSCGVLLCQFANALLVEQQMGEGGGLEVGNSAGGEGGGFATYDLFMLMWEPMYIRLCHCEGAVLVVNTSGALFFFAVNLPQHLVTCYSANLATDQVPRCFSLASDTFPAPQPNVSDPDLVGAACLCGTIAVLVKCCLCHAFVPCVCFQHHHIASAP